MLSIFSKVAYLEWDDYLARITAIEDEGFRQSVRRAPR